MNRWIFLIFRINYTLPNLQIEIKYTPYLESKYYNRVYNENTRIEKVEKLLRRNLVIQKLTQIIG